MAASSLQDCLLKNTANPALKRWANIRCAYGAFSTLWRGAKAPTVRAYCGVAVGAVAGAGMVSAVGAAAGNGVAA